MVTTRQSVGDDVELGDYSGVDEPNFPEFVRQQVHDIHEADGIASYNHPFGYEMDPLLSAAEQDARVSQLSSALLTNDLLGSDLIEVGYPIRGKCDIEHHLMMWDVLSRHARFTTGTGTSDDHGGRNWHGIGNNWYTSVWSRTKDSDDLVDGLRAGRAWFASLSRFRGTLDLVADGACSMGSASVSQVIRRQLQVIGTEIPTGGRVEVIRGVVDYTGSTASTAIAASHPASAFASGAVTLPIDTSQSCFVRTQVFDANGLLVAVSTPIWLLREKRPRRIPHSRAH